ncbi:MAG: phosphonoacetaldehyde reductase [Bdellovibrionales bacterium]|nr:phosphonoacetaldehyde reductase [Bdellovibrionales bacterium]
MVRLLSDPKLQAVIAGRGFWVLATEGTLKRSAKILDYPKPLGIFSEIAPNPTIAAVQKAANAMKSNPPEILLAIGGGSTLDTAKGVAALLCPELIQQSDWLSLHLRNGVPLPKEFQPLPIIAIPTTAGTGSEVTPFGTIWDEKTGAKYSIHHPKLFSEAAILIPELTATQPHDLSLFTGLDAFSHALETLWNRNRNPESVKLASGAVQKLLKHLPRVLKEPRNLESRREVQEASVWAGQAIAQNRTALAHSMSYPITSELDVPHGLACSFSLGEVLRVNAQAELDQMKDVFFALSVKSADEGVSRVYAFFKELGLAAELNKKIPGSAKLLGLKGKLIQAARADNNLAQVDDLQARQILVRAWDQVMAQC